MLQRFLIRWYPPAITLEWYVVGGLCRVCGKPCWDDAEAAPGGSDTGLIENTRPQALTNRKWPRSNTQG